MKTTRLAAMLALALPAFAMPALAAAPQYTITDLGAVAPYEYSQAFGISSNGASVVGRGLSDVTTSTWPAFVWQAASGMQALGAVSGYGYAAGYAVNNSGVSVGVAAMTAQGSGPVPVVWRNGSATQLALPTNLGTGNVAGRAYGINNAGMAVGSAGGGNSEEATIFNTNTNTTTVITARTADASRAYMQTAFSISDTGMVFGTGVDINEQNVALMYNSNTGAMTQIVAPQTGGFYTALGFDVSSNGQYAVGTFGSGSTNQPFIWSASTGVLTAVGLPAVSSNGILRGVNDSGWAVGNSGGFYSNPFLYADGSTYAISDVIANESGWNFTTTTSAAALGISDNGLIIGTAQFNGIEHAYMLTPVPEPTTCALMLAGLVGVGAVLRRRSHAGK